MCLTSVFFLDCAMDRGLLIVLMFQISHAIVFDVQPESQAIVYGEDLLLHCNAHDPTSQHQSLQYDWFFNSVSKPENSSIFTNHSILVRSLTEKHIGNYTCGVMDPDGGSLLDLSPVAVVIHAYIRAFEINPAPKNITEGDLLELQCVTGQSAPPASVYWEKNGLSFTGDNQVTVTYGTSPLPGVINQSSMKLVITNAAPTDSGMYNCVAFNPKLGVEVRSLKVNVRVQALEQSPSVDPDVYKALVYAPRGHNFLLDCPIKAYPPPFITWEVNGDPLVGDDDRFKVGNGSLFLANMNVDKDGIYRCEGQNSLGMVWSPNINLRTTYIEMDFRREPYRIFAIAGQPQQIPCDPPESRPSANVTWYKDSQPMTYRAGDRAVFIVDPPNHVWDLFFSSVQEEDEGEYFCVATNQFSVPMSRTSVSGVMSVGGAPTLVQPPISVTVIKGEGFHLTCLVSGDPFPTIQWTQEQTVILPSPQILLSNKNQELHVAGATKANEGTYTCRATNSYGNIESDAYVHVLVPTVIVRKLSNTSVSAGSTIKLPCEVYGDPKPLVLWQKDYQNFTLGGRFVKEEDGLLITNVSLGDAGVYSCLAFNEAGNASGMGFLEVTATPFFIQKPEDTVVVIGHSFNLSCIVSGNPIPAVDWLYNGTNLFPPGILLSLNKQLLSVGETAWHHAGRYTCVAASTEGAISWTASVRIQVPPTVYRIVGNAIVYLEKDLELICLTDGVPSPSITWQKDGLQLSPSTDQRVSFPEKHRLLVRVATSSDSGDYKCISYNVVGSSEMSVTIYVVGTPTPPVLQDPVAVSSSSIHVVWSPATQPPNTPVTQYFVYYRTGQQADFVRHPTVLTSTEMSLIVDGLTPGTEYYFAVSSGNAAGEGVKSNIKMEKTLDAGPSEPRNVRAIQVFAHSVQIGWVLPSITNGIIKKYRVWYGETSGISGQISEVVFVNSSSTTPQHTVTGLKPFTSYSFAVQAATIEGQMDMWGNMSQSVQVVTAIAAPTGSPTRVVAIATSASTVQVTWQQVQPEQQNGPIRFYVIKYHAVDADDNDMQTTLNISQVSSLSKDIAALRAWTWYSFVVEAGNDAGVGPSSSEVIVRTGPAEPSLPPVDIVFEAIDRSTLMFDFQLPEAKSWNGDIGGVVVEYGQNVSMATQTLAVNIQDTWSVNITNLKPWTVYRARAAIFNQQVRDLQGPFSDWYYTQTSEGVPSSVEAVSYTATPTSITLQWQPPSDPNGIILGYLVHYVLGSAIGHLVQVREKRQADSDVFHHVSPDENSLVLKELVPDTSYNVTVAAYNLFSVGENATITASTEPLPTTPYPTTSETAATTQELTTQPPSTTALTLLGGKPDSEEQSGTLYIILSGSIAGFILVLFVVVLAVCMFLRQRQALERSKPAERILDNESPVDMASPDHQQSSSTDTSSEGEVRLSMDKAKYRPSLGSHSVVPNYNGMKDSHSLSAHILQPAPSFAPRSHKSLPGVQNPGYLSDNPPGYSDDDTQSVAVSMTLSAEEVYSPSNTLKRQSRLRNEAAAAIAVMKTNAMTLPGIDNDTDSLINNDAYVIYTERTAL